MLSLIIGHATTLSVKLAVGFVLSNLYVPFHVLLFPARSLAHTYNVLSHSVLSVITVPFVYTVPFAVQSPALTQLYFAVHVFASVCVNTIEISAFFHVVELFVALIVGTIVSYIVLIVFDTVFVFVAKSFATHAGTFTVTTHCPLGVTVQLYVHPNPLIVPFPIVTSVEIKLYIVSVNVPVTVNAVFVYAPTADVNVIPGDVVSILIFLFAHSDHAAHGVNNVNTPLFPTLSFIVHQSKMSAPVLR